MRPENTIRIWINQDLSVRTTIRFKLHGGTHVVSVGTAEEIISRLAWLAEGARAIEDRIRSPLGQGLNFQDLQRLVDQWIKEREDGYDEIVHD